MPRSGGGSGGPGSAGGDSAGGKGSGRGSGAARPAPKRQPAERLPVARVAVDTPLPHLDRLFDYRVSAEQDADAVPGCRVRVPFHGRKLSGFLIERVSASEFGGRLSYLDRVVSPEPVLTPEVRALARAVADRYAGTLSDVLRLAVPPRHGRVEREHLVKAAPEAAAEGPAEAAESGSTTGEGGSGAEQDPASGAAAPAGGPAGAPADGPGTAAQDRGADRAAADGASAGEGEAGAAPDTPAPPASGPWSAYPDGPSFLEALAGGGAPRAVWTALPGPDWAAAIATAAAAAAASGRGTVVVMPDARDVQTVDAALSALPVPLGHVALTAELGPAERYRRWLAALRGTAPVVVGTRAAMFAPVRDVGLVVLWDDGDDVHTDPHAPYPNARTVLTLRAHLAGAGALIGGFTRTAEGARLAASGWAGALTADRTTVRARAPRIEAAGDDRELVRDEAARTARLPGLAPGSARDALAAGPVLVQVPRRGYLASLACSGCRAPARCDACQGPLELRSAHAAPYCRWCGRLGGAWACPDCGSQRVRAVVVGDRRTAEELGRAFPQVPVRTSGRDEVLDTVADRPALVVATPGAEPAAPGGYAAALLLDGWALLTRADLRASEEALRRWLSAAALVRPAGEGGRVVVMADAQEPPVQAAVRWDPVGFSGRELEQRVELGFPPAVTMASVTGAPEKVRELLGGLDLPQSAELLGPVPADPGRGPRGDAPPAERALIRVPHSDAPSLTAALKTAASARSARSEDHLAQVRVDPLHLI
ncbi:hypothetical protein GCM10027440_40510 [Nocardiopsis coralliicola]